MIHISLIGDSVFDNKSYVGEAGTDVITHLRNMLPDQSKASLIANDGDVIKKVSDEQISRIPSTSTHLIISVGGNDAIMNADILNLEMGTSAEVLSEISGRQKIFENDYTEMLESLTKIGLPVGVCTVYNPNFDDPSTQKIAETALCAFNDSVIRKASEYGLPILDLRLICSEKDDYANDIEPSEKGGEKIAKNIAELVNKHDFDSNRPSIYF